MSVVGVILAAGPSIRFNSPVHKQYLKLNGKELIYYSIRQMRASKCFHEIIAVVDKTEYESQYIANKYGIKCILGGETRNQSIQNAIDYYKSVNEPDYILFHDCSRPLCEAILFSTVVKMLEDYDAVAPASLISDGVVNNQLINVPRDQYRLVRTPEAFDFGLLTRYFNKDSMNTSIISQIPSNENIKLFMNNTFDFKITYPEDLFVAEQLVNTSYESTKFEDQNLAIEGKILLLGGSGGVGQCLIDYLEEHDADYYAPSHADLDLMDVTVEQLTKKIPFSPDIIINASASYASDDEDYLETFDRIMNVNVRANLVLIKYAQTLGHRVNIVLLSSSSSTRGRENLTNYSASKAALNSIVESQGSKLKEKEVYLNAIVPEKINTPLIEKLHKQKINKRELLEPFEVIPIIVKYCNTEESGKIVHVRKGL